MAVALMATANGNIVGVTADDDGDGSVTCTAVWDDSTSTLSVTCIQNWAPGHLLGTVTADTQPNPSMWVINTVQNSTGSAWGGYHLGISMTNAFSIVGIVAPPDWTWEITAPTQVGSQFVGGIDMTGGTPVGVNESAFVGYVISFSGSVEFVQEMIPMEIPEPASLAALILVGALFGWRIRRRA